MHTRASRLLILCFLTAALSASADTIHLKNGRTIHADQTREVDGKIEYEIGDNTFAIPKSSVERIETGGMAAPRTVSPAAAAAELPALEPTGTVKHAEQVKLSIIKDGHVDLDALAAADQQPDTEFTAAAYFVAGKFEQSHGNPDKARIYLQRAMSLMPNNPVIQEQFASLLLDMNRFADAVPYALQATRLAPNSADAHALLGYAYFHSEKTKQAIAEYKRSLEINPDPGVQKLLELAQREESAEASFGEQESGHFTMRYEGGKAPEALRAAIMQTLERHYDELVLAFGISPRQNIVVSLYTEQAFFDVTHAPAWSAAQNDGKLRIPISGLDAVNSELSRVLKHELAHSFIAQITRNRCPTWLNEGIAQVVEPASAAPFGALLGRMFAHDAEIPLNTLEGSFNGLEDRAAYVAYGESLAAVEYIVQTYGMSDVVRLLQRIGEGASTESALRSVVHSGYASFQTDVGDYLKKTYGE